MHDLRAAIGQVISQMAGAPRFPNLGRTVSSTVPVVTTLLAGFSSGATFLALQADHPRSAMLNFPIISHEISSISASIVLGLAATGSFVLASVLAVHAQASNFEALSTPEQQLFLEQLGLKTREEAVRQAYLEQHNNLYETVRFFWKLGLVLLSLTFGMLSVGTVRWLGFLGGVIGVLVSAFAVKEFHSSRLLWILASLLSAVIGLGSIWGACC